MTDESEPEGLTYEESLPLIDQLARSLARRYPPVEFDDIQQQLRLYLWKARERMLSKGLAWINFELLRQGAKWCRKQRAKQLDLNDQYFYTPEDIEKALEVFFTPEDWNSFTPPEPGLFEDGSDEYSGVAMLLDVRRVWDKLTPNSQQALFYIYGTKVSVESYAFEAEIEPDVAKKRVQRARDELGRALNNPKGGDQSDLFWYEGPGARTAMSNSAAQAQSAFAWQRDYSDVTGRH